MKLFETIKFSDDTFHHLNFHQERINTSLKKLNLNRKYILKDILTPPNTNETYRTKFIYDKDGFSFEHFLYKQKIIKSLSLIDASHIEYSLKYLDRKDIDILKNKSDDEIIMIKDDYVTDTSIANLYFLKYNTWFTPSTSLLRGTYQKNLLENTKVKLADIRVKDILKYKNIAISNAMIGFFELKEDIISNIKHLE